MTFDIDSSCSVVSFRIGQHTLALRPVVVICWSDPPPLTLFPTDSLSLCISVSLSLSPSVSVCVSVSLSVCLCCISRFSQDVWPGSWRCFTEKNIQVQLKHRKYSFLTILLTGSSTMHTCKWHILPRNVYNKCSASRVDPGPASVLHLY